MPWQRQGLDELRRRLPARPGQLWIMSSGTTAVNEVKLIGLSHEGIRASAAAVNLHLRATGSDTWLLALPTYHIGGYAIPVRAELSGASVVYLPEWKADDFARLAIRSRVTLSALVPTQVHDLVTAGIRAPEGLRAIVVGGGSLAPELYRRARKLGWPLLPSYGLTECASQVATADLESLGFETAPDLTPLSHARIEIRDGVIWVNSVSCAGLVARYSPVAGFSLEDPLRGGWLRTGDLGQMHDGRLRVIGRTGSAVKILGVLVAIDQVEHDLRAMQLEARLAGDFMVHPSPSAREGYRLTLICTGAGSLGAWQLLVRTYNQRVQGPYRIAQFAWTADLPKSPLGKIRRADAATALGF